MNPTREQFELAARAAGVNAMHDSYGTLRNCTGANPETNIYALPIWQPHIPGVDNAMLAASIGDYRTTVNDFGCAVFVDDLHHICEHDAFTGTETERRAKAMAWAVFLVAVEIGRGMK